MAFEVPVLLIIFNRPDVTAEVMATLRKVRPRRLFIAADAPRPNIETDAELCRRSREIASNPDWECEVITLFQNENLGVGRGRMPPCPGFSSKSRRESSWKTIVCRVGAFSNSVPIFSISIEIIRGSRRWEAISFCRIPCGCSSLTIFPSISRCGVGRVGVEPGGIIASISHSCPKRSGIRSARKILLHRWRQNIGSISSVLWLKGPSTPGIFSSI
jgi:hypothetical protein